MMAKHWRFERMNKRELLKSVYHEWRKTGHPRLRGFAFCDLSVARKNLYFLTDFVRQAYGVLDVEAMANGEFNEAARLFFERHGIAIESEILASKA